MDNVPPCRGIKPIIEEGVIATDGRTVLGADDKSGVAAILEALHTLKEMGGYHLPIEIVLTVREETGLEGAKNLDFRQLRAKRALTLDSSGAIGSVITRAPGSNIIDATILGRAAHAGVAPEKGLSSIFVASQAIAKMRLGKIDEETTANVGTIHGGTARNIVPELVEIKAETRSHNESKLEDQTRLMLGALEEAATGQGAKLALGVERAYTAFHIPDDDDLVQHILLIASDLGLSAQTAASGGGSDANIFNSHGIKAVNLAMGYEDNHSTHEHIALESLAKATELIVALLRTS
jgi:tripeptide aminopeptidase